MNFARPREEFGGPRRQGGYSSGGGYGGGYGGGRDSYQAGGYGGQQQQGSYGGGYGGQQASYGYAPQPGYGAGMSLDRLVTTRGWG